MKAAAVLFGVLGGIAVGFAVGRYIAPAGRRVANDERARRSEIVEAKQRQARVSSGAASTSPVYDDGAELSPGARLRQLLTITSPRRRAYEMETYLAELAASDLPAMLLVLQKLPGRGDRIQLTSLLFARWGELDGPGALAATAQMPPRDRWLAEAGVFDGWARSDPRAAWAVARDFAADNPTAGFRGYGPLRELARIDLAGAIDEVTNLPVQLGKLAGRDAIIETAAQDGTLEAVMRTALNVSVPAEREAWIQAVFSRWGSVDSDAPMNALRSIPDPELARSAMQGLMTGWGETDPRGAIDFAFEHQSDPLVAGSLDSVLRNIVHTLNEAEIRDIVDSSRTQGAFERVAPQIAGSIGFTHPALALEIAGALADDGERTRLANATFSIWGRTDLGAAATHFEGMPNTPARTGAFRALSEVALRQSDGPATVARWMSTFSDTDRVKAAENLVQVLEQQRRQPSAQPWSTAAAGTLAQAIAATPDLPSEILARSRRLLSSAPIP